MKDPFLRGCLRIPLPRILQHFYVAGNGTNPVYFRYEGIVIVPAPVKLHCLPVLRLL